MPFVVKKTEDGKFGLYNKTKKEMTKRTFKTKESAEKMASHYDNFSQMKKTKKSEPKEEVKEEEPASAPKKKKVVRKVNKQSETEDY